MRIRRHRQTQPRPQRYPEDLRREIVAHVRAGRARGESVEAVSKSLGMSPFTLYEWLRHDAEPRGGFRRVDVVPRAAEPVTLTTPQGYRLEGDAASVAAVLKALL
jgi:transposase-like protein